ncbi:bifunctional folylpolyglutamate synthase/dihydrofolate synthase [Winogradskyella undariae]|uniref:bifunctional folylpolyglutamate synthase/dihydrofolate synthase n=1 Tax=Winogradskyella TaxID=286104 RepID=UPI00156B7B4E|nr:MULTISPECIES: folylpolyglutamate synthase/dihydrofolate synthase family protein [Winogradskyella]NRR93481.1 bifunctional folylpolyglutamate synthase/dihydrofolate synthase [Winogradskyella undariae]QXP77805.1 bifunctional folylpolyglutamate synthase/dihydrofolate synthase [Winogradskyella sp. HaHa_3_26]
MNYQDTVNWMFNQLPMYQNKGKSAFKTDITNTINLATHLNHPENDFKSIHVAGTNGKGSTSHMLASVLQEEGYKVGLYTSPHLKDFRERIRISGDVISEDFVIEFIQKNLSFFEENQLSFFEMTVGMAFDYFAKQKVDIAVIEVGLGGRLDSTNIITPELSVITNIGLDHTQMLGDTLQLIAGEKAGIIKKNIPVVIGETQLETQDVFKLKAASTESKIYFADQLINEVLESDLKGTYQNQNKKTVLQSLNILKELGYLISDEAIQTGLLNVTANTGLQGRWQQLDDKPKIICDTAHNNEGLTYVMQQLQKESFDKLHIVFGVVNDKDLERIIPLLPKVATYYFCKPNVQRGLDAEILKKTFTANGLIGKTYNSVELALTSAKSNAKKNDFIYVGGSTFVVAEII